MTIKRFEDLRIWQQARAQVNAVHDSFGYDASAGEGFGFHDQIRRCAVSVMNNIAKGFERRNEKHFAHFLNTAKSSNGEVHSMLCLAEYRHYLTTEIAREMRSFAESLSEGIESLARHLRIE